MLMRFDPFREVDRLTEAMLGRAILPRMPHGRPPPRRLDAVLTLTLPIAEQVKPRRVEIASINPKAQPIDTAARSIA
jgi:hypothetical protein